MVRMFSMQKPHTELLKSIEWMCIKRRVHSELMSVAPYSFYDIQLLLLLADCIALTLLLTLLLAWLFLNLFIQAELYSRAVHRFTIIKHYFPPTLTLGKNLNPFYKSLLALSDYLKLLAWLFHFKHFYSG